jgi:type II secretory pathway pseudopilin PulG
MLMVLVTALNVLVAAALPTWTSIEQREREEELIFRGLQYAEAIRVFQARNGRFPVSLDELVKIHPRAARQLWADPMTPDGRWGLIYASAPGQGIGEGGSRGGISGSGVAPVGISGAMSDAQSAFGDDPDGEEPRAAPISRREQRIRRRAGLDGTLGGGPIVGVHSLSEEEALKSFAGGGKYSDWKFTVDLLPSGGPTGENVPRLNAAFAGRPLPAGVQPADGTGLDEDSGLDDDAKERNDRRDRRNRRERQDRGRGGDG